MVEPISATVPDWSREIAPVWSWQPGRALMRSIRDYQRLEERQGLLSGLLRKIIVVRHRFWSAMSGADIPLTCQIGGGLLLPHPNGIVIHPEARIGPNCLIFQQVTVGAAHDGVPMLGGHVDIGAGAKIIGGIRIGDHVQIGANAVVISNLPSGVSAVGVPARIVAQTGQTGSRASRE